eukprot:5274357-Amphidinium_carterae.2
MAGSAITSIAYTLGLVLTISTVKRTGVCTTTQGVLPQSTINALVNEKGLVRFENFTKTLAGTPINNTDGDAFKDSADEECGARNKRIRTESGITVRITANHVTIM